MKVRVIIRFAWPEPVGSPDLIGWFVTRFVHEDWKPNRYDAANAIAAVTCFVGLLDLAWRLFDLAGWIGF